MSPSNACALRKGISDPQERRRVDSECEAFLRKTATELTFIHEGANPAAWGYPEDEGAQG